MRTVFLAFVIGWMGAAVLAAPPALQELKPWGAARGKAFILTLVGSNLAHDSRIVSPLAAAFTPLTPSDENGANQGEELPFLVELKADAPVGLYPIRVASPDGISNVLLFSVGAFPERVEKESTLRVHQSTNDRPQDGELVEVPVTVNGTLRGPDRDVYRFRAQKGQQLVLEVEARRAGSAVDPVITVLDSQHNRLASNHDAPGAGLDCRVEVSVPADGDYCAVVHDARFSDQQKNFYRLKIGSFTYAEGVFPLGWKRGETVKVHFAGGNLKEPVQSVLDLSRVPEGDSLTAVNVPGAPGSLPLVFAVSDMPEVLEPEDKSGAFLTSSTVLNGRISEPGEVDRYRLSVKPGESWTIDLEAIELGTSRLFGVLSVYDQQGKLLASAGDEIPDPGVFALIAVGRTSSDPFVQFTVPENVGEVTVTVEDLVRRGGPLFGYRLWATRQPADFRLSLGTPFVNIPAGGTALVSVNVQRRGYTGAVQLKIPNAGEDLVVEGGYVPAEIPNNDNRIVSRRGILTVTAKESMAPGMAELTVIGEGALDEGRWMRRRARGPGLITQVLGGTGVPDPNLADVQKPFTAAWLGMELPAMVTKAIPARLQVEAPRRIRILQGMQYDLPWSVVSDEKNFRPPRRVSADVAGAQLVSFVPKDRKEEYVKKGATEIRVLFGARPQKFNVVLAGQVELNGKTETLYTPALTVEVVQGYEIGLATNRIVVPPGSSAELKGRLTREPGFPNPVRIEARYLPRGVSCEPADVLPDGQEFALAFVAAPQARAGEYEIEIDSSSTMVGAGKDKALPYNIPPLRATLIVPAKGATQRKGVR